MNWISENKFLSGFAGFMIVGIAVLGFFLIQAMGDYGAEHEKYTTKLHQLEALQNLTPYPNPENLENYKTQETALATVIEGLEQKLDAIQFPLDNTMTPAKFQKELQTTVSDDLAKAKANSITVPEKFALGFDKYLSTPPLAGAAAPLDRELKALQLVFDELLDGNGVDSIASGQPVDRAPLPEESGAKPSTALVVKSPVEITFVADQVKVHKVLNDLVQTNKQFYIVRLIEIKQDEKDTKPLGKTEAMKNRKDKSGKLRFALGEEKLQVTLSLEVVNFNPPTK